MRDRTIGINAAIERLHDADDPELTAGARAAHEHCPFPPYDTEPYTCIDCIEVADAVLTAARELRADGPAT